jgi:ABC-type polysaccharide/polyol phosphate export permease
MLHYTVLLLTLLDMLFFDFVRRDCSRTFLCRLKSIGVGAEHILCAKLPFLLATKAALLTVVLMVLELIFGLTLTAWTLLSAACFLLFSSVTGVCLCALLQKSNVGPCLLCALGFAGMFLCGGLVAYDMLPETVTRLSILTPMGIGASMLSPVYGGRINGNAYVLGLLMCLCLCVGAWFYTESLRVKGSEQA